MQVQLRRQSFALPGWRALPLALMAALATALPVRAQATATLQEALQLAVCLNDWDNAIARARQLEQTPGLPIKTQAELVLFGRRMRVLRQNQAVVRPIDGCEPVLAGFGLPGYTGRPPDLERALANSGFTAPLIVPDLVLRREAARWQAGLGVSAEPPLAPLAEARRINTRTGSGVSTGAVSRRVDVYAFLGAAGNRANLALDVIQQRPGLLYTDDAASLFIFDAEGRLLAESRTRAGVQPRVAALPLTATGVYYAAVTTPQHSPILDDQGFLVGWQGIGTSAITYTLTLNGLTPSPRLGPGGR